MKPDEAVLTVSDLRVTFTGNGRTVHAVNGLSYQLQKGSTLAIIGESGSGKSVSVRALMGLLSPTAQVSGSARISDVELVGLPDHEMRRLRGTDLAMIFQDPSRSLNPTMKIGLQIVEAVCAHEKVERRQAVERGIELLRLVRLPAPERRFHEYPHQLSGGMRQRIMIALALVLQPSFVVADEPTTALDVLVEAQIIGILADLRRNFDTALLFITHNLGIVAETCDRVAVMYAGRIVEQGPVRDVFARPQHPYTRELLRSTISLSTTGLHYIPGAPPDLIDPPPGCRFHPRCPEAMRVCREQFPVPVEAAAQTVECWLHGPHDLVPEGGTEPMPREEITVADEA
mgnify:CR=1 FL=1